ncbi:MAG: hypothetical protein JWQ72_2032 [Polaromonas sp.]|nr:hypothetical protein [Polaromonas sp.]
MRISHRIQDWAADRFNRVQYPQSRFATRRSAAPAMPFGTWLTLLAVGLTATVLGSAVLAFILFFFVPALFTAAFGS